MFVQTSCFFLYTVISLEDFDSLLCIESCKVLMYNERYFFVFLLLFCHLADIRKILFL